MLPDKKPATLSSRLDREEFALDSGEYSINILSSLLGMSSTFIRKVVGRRKYLNALEILALLDEDSFQETFAPRSLILRYLKSLHEEHCHENKAINCCDEYNLIKGDAKDLIKQIEKNSVQCVVTSTPYWGMRIYDEYVDTSWADGHCCPFGHEQTPNKVTTA